MNLLFGFSGRIGRLEYWLGQLAIIVLSIVCVGIIIAVVGIDRLGAMSKTDLATANTSVVMIVFAATLLTVWMSFALCIKRFHDRDKSGLWCLIVLIPYIGALWQFVECGFLAGTQGSNRFGPPGGLGGGRSPVDSLELVDAYAPPPPLRPASAATASAAPTGRFRRQAQQGFGRRGI